LETANDFFHSQIAQSLWGLEFRHVFMSYEKGLIGTGKPEAGGF
jgi:hypothetical protein